MLKRVPATKLFINLLYGTGRATIDFYIFCNDLKRWGYHYESARESRALYKRLQNKKYANKLLHNLKRSRYIKVNSVGHNLIVTLTNEGRMFALRQKIRGAVKLTNSYTVVIFDIPEVKRLARDLFRHLLKESDFIMLQQSVWLSRRDSKAALIEFIKEQKIEKWVNVFYAKDFFNLPSKLFSQ